MTVDALASLEDDIGQLLGRGRLATAVSAACLVCLVVAGVMLMSQSGLFPPPTIGDDAPVVSRR